MLLYTKGMIVLKEEKCTMIIFLGNTFYVLFVGKKKKKEEENKRISIKFLTTFETSVNDCFKRNRCKSLKCILLEM